MPITREFLGWKRPALMAAAERLCQQYGRAAELDLQHVIIVVPTGRAARRLLEILVVMAQERGLVLAPPEIITPEALPERLYEPKRRFADELVQQLAWVAALQEMRPEELAAFLPYPPDKNDAPRWLAVAETLRRLHTELAADGIDCGRVLKRAAEVEGFAEHARWEVLCKLERAYLTILDRLELWDVQTARLVAIQKREIATDKQIVLLGTVDLNRAHRQIVDQIADRVTAFIAAPQELAERFDEHGCLIPAEWTEAEVPLKDEQIDRVDGPADQAQAVTRWLASLGGRYRADEIVIGVPDKGLVPQIQRQLAQEGIGTRFGEERKVGETGPFRLLKAAADYAARRRFRDFAALVRHPDVGDWVERRWRRRSRRKEDDGPNVPHVPLAERADDTRRADDAQRAQCTPGAALDYLTALDRFASERFPSRLDEERLEKDEKAAAVRGIYRAIERLIRPLTGKSKALGEWADRLRSVLSAVYGARELDRTRLADRYLLAALKHLGEGLDAAAEVPPQLQPTVDARQACQILLASLAGQALSPPAAGDAVELLGWLDLPLDDAPAAIVTTFNEGWVPSSLTADLFLPNRLREALDLLHNDRRLARDAYALSVLLASREELRLIVAHRDEEGNPLAPSRLLFATDRDHIVARARRFFGDLPAARPRRCLLLPEGLPPARSALAPPRPARLAEPIRELSVTRFRDYIACPYRFYLRHVLALEAMSDEAAELDGAAFGNLVHLVLEQFGRGEDAKDVRTKADPRQIIEYLEYELDRMTKARYGTDHVRPAVRVQIEQVRLRLRAFADWQAQRAREGWRIIFSEDSESRRKFTADFRVDGQPFTLSGRIDRIDYHEECGKVCVLDYKTADSGQPPDKSHRRGDEWIDLQLPLYRHLVRGAKLGIALPEDVPIELGYVLLPRDLRKVGLALAEWDWAELESADETARQIIRAILDGQFWPPKLPPPAFADDLAVICQDHRLGALKFLPEDAA